MRFFYMHVGSFVAVIVYFTFAGGAEYSAAGVRTALTVALAVETVYVWLARRAGELKHFDVGLWLLFATGTLATTAGFTGLARVFEHFRGVIWWNPEAMRAWEYTRSTQIVLKAHAARFLAELNRAGFKVLHDAWT